MKKTIGYRLLRLGRISPRWRDGLEAEGIRVLDEGIRCTITYRNYRAPGRYFAWRRSMGSGAIVLTHKRFLLFYYRWLVLDVELADPQLERIGISSSAPDALVLAFDASDLDRQRSGSITIRLRTSEAPGFLRVLSVNRPVRA
jgi:hypothetical protein